MRLSRELVNDLRYWERLGPDEHVLDSIRSYTQWSAKIPAAVTLRMSAKVSPQDIKTRGSLALLDLMSESAGLLGFFVISNVYKTNQLVELFIESLRRGRYVTGALAARSLVEYAATVAFYYSELEPLTRKVQEFERDGDYGQLVRAFGKIRNISRLYYVRTRFNWGFLRRGDIDSINGDDWKQVDKEKRQVNILTLVQVHAAKESPDLEFFYDFLSDLCHPNYGSHLLVVDAWPNAESKVPSVRLVGSKGSRQRRRRFVWYTSIPTRISLDMIRTKLDKLWHAYLFMTGVVATGRADLEARSHPAGRSLDDFTPP